MQVFRSSGFLVCLSAFLFALGSYFAALEVPVRISYDPAAAEQYDLMRAYLPFGLILCFLAFISLVYGVVFGVRKPSRAAQLRKPLLVVSIIVGVALGFLALSSTLLPWVITERPEPFIETRGGMLNVGQIGLNICLTF
ncbi:MAG: hypothetical protein QXX99_02075 [Candidatus Bathyarchaeia archaeon]